MVLLASELVGPYVDRIVTFVGYPPALVQVIAARLQEARIWEGDEVRCESWLDPQKRPTALNAGSHGCRGQDRSHMVESKEAIRLSRGRHQGGFTLRRLIGDSHRRWS